MSNAQQRIGPTQVLGGLALWAVRTAILVLFIRIFHSIRWMRITSYCLIVITALFYASSLIVIVVSCVRRKDQASQIIPPMETLVIAAYGVLIDITIFVLPLPSISSLRLDARKKIGIVVVFLVAFL